MMGTLRHYLMHSQVCFALSGGGDTKIWPLVLLPGHSCHILHPSHLVEFRDLIIIKSILFIMMNIFGSTVVPNCKGLS